MNLQHIGLIITAFIMLPAMTSCKSHSPADRIGFEEARAMFASRGVQPGQPLPPLSLVDLDGQPADLPRLQQGKPLALVTASLTCNVARRQQKDVDQLRQQLGDRAMVVVIYTIDAHPKTDACPYTGKEWVPRDNERDNVLVRQPTTLDERLSLARQYQQRFSSNAIILVDTMDNASWHALGEAPNLGLLVDRDGIVQLRQGWFDAKQMQAAIAAY
jgi:hypothetical protein